MPLSAVRDLPPGLIVGAAIMETVQKLDLTYPKIDAAKKKELAAVRAALAREK